MSENNTAQTGIEGLEVEVMRLPVITTAHISHDTRIQLAEGRHPWVNHCAAYEFGWFLAVPTEEKSRTQEPPPPAELAAVFEWARKNNFGWI
ncbi:MAG: hypothetical protein COZ38_12265, partial [Rhodocyclales bacterium CG_4_10_14_3_um_filter_68_10]